MLKTLIFTCLIIYTNILFSFPKPNVHYLKNGATAVIVVDPNSKISSSYVFVRSGSINEGEFLGSGVSHYLEHLLAGGTTAFKSEKEYQNIIDNLGGAYNAYTSYDHTAYYIHTSSININKALQTLYEWTVFGDWTSDEFFRENGVIKKEMERAENNIDRKIYQNTQQLFYQKSPYQYPILGYTDIFDTLTDQDLRKYHKQNYIPKNFVIVVGGDVSKNAVIELIENTFGQQLNKAPKNTYSGTSQQILSESMSSIVIP